MTVDPNRRGPNELNPSSQFELESAGDDNQPTQVGRNPDLTSIEIRAPHHLLAPKLEQLGAYRIVRELGAGGMGKVYEAEDTILGRRVALKVMNTGMPDEMDSKKRFLREAQAAAAVSHDHIVTIYQVGEDRGIPFLAMQLLEGETLGDRLERERILSIDEIIRIGFEMAEGLAAAHRRGLIHRDIKPANIWLERPRNRVKILDFGLARASEPEQRLTHSGVVMGTPAYMSPEQSRGDELDTRSDLFSLGCILYEMATGVRPFDGPSFIAIIRNLELHNPVSVKELRPEIPTSLSNLIQRLIAKNREERWASAQEVAEALLNLDRTESAPTLFIGPSPAPAPPSVGFRTPTLQPRPITPSLPATPTPSFLLPTIQPRPSLVVAEEKSHDYPRVNTNSAIEEPPAAGGGGMFRFFFFLLLVSGLGYWGWSEFLNKGVLIIETQDRSAKIEITQGGVTRILSYTERRFELKPGTYELVLLDGIFGSRLEKTTVTIKRGETETVRLKNYLDKN